MNSNSPTKHRFSGCLQISLIVAAALGFVGYLFVYPILSEGEKVALTSTYCQYSSDIGRGLFQYAADHNGKYPEGKSSTEVFQKLIDEGYVTDPSVFFCRIPGKVQPDGKSLKPENVGWDVTCCVDSNSPDDLPVVFSTGYKIKYARSSTALPQQKPNYSLLQWWPDWWNGYHGDYLVVCEKSTRVTGRKPAPDGSIPNFIPADFDPKGKTYRQLTPDGELPP